MTQDDVLFGYRLQLFDLAARTTVVHACRTFGVHRSTYYRWKAQVDRQGLEMLRPRERRRPVMPNQLPQVLEERIIAFSLGHPGLGPRRIAAMLARPKWGGLVVSPNGVYKALRRHGLSTRAKRLSLLAGYRAPYQPPREPAPEPHIDTTRPGELVGFMVAAGSTRSDANVAVAERAAVILIPFRRMGPNPYVWPVRYPHEDDLERFHTRRVAKSIPTLNAVSAVAPPSEVPGPGR